MARRLDIDRDEIEVTRGEKLLAVVLPAFVLVELIWGYDKLEIGSDRIEPSPSHKRIEPRSTGRRWLSASSVRRT